MQPLTLLFNFVSRFKYFVIAFWILAAGGTGYFVPKFLASTTTSFTPPKSSLAYEASFNFSRDFPQQAYQSTFAVYCTTTEEDIICPAFWTFSNWFSTLVSNYTIKMGGKVV